MKKSTNHIKSDKCSNVKEISDGVYINLERITSNEGEFEKAVEASFKELDEMQHSSKNKKNKTSKTDRKE